MEEKYKTRQVLDNISGTRFWGGSTQYNKDLPVMLQRTSLNSSIWPWIRSNWNDPKWPSHIRDFWHRQDWGTQFMTEKGSIKSSLNSLHLSGNYAGNWSIDSEGPVFLSGFSQPMPLATTAALADESHIMFALGGTGINRTRPGKPELDLAVTIGELRTGGIPKMVGSLYERARTLRDVFRETGNEYLNLQFGWAPLVRDIQSLCKVVSSTRELLERHEKMLNKLLTRGCDFDSTINTVGGLSSPSNLYAYELYPTAPYGAATNLCMTRTANGAPVIETVRTVTKSYFRAGYRFYYPDIQTALKELQEFEANANLLMGTRLDPEVLWNLQPWTWLIDWFVNFGDVLGNLSAIIADGLVIQYAYIMREVEIDREIYLPRGVHAYSSNTGWKSATPPLTINVSYHRKMRAKASPFGFGLTPDEFTPQQWAILAALGISRGLK